MANELSFTFSGVIKESYENIDFQLLPMAITQYVVSGLKWVVTASIFSHVAIDYVPIVHLYTKKFIWNEYLIRQTLKKLLTV